MPVFLFDACAAEVENDFGGLVTTRRLAFQVWSASYLAVTTSRNLHTSY